MAKRKSEFVRWMGPVLDALRELGGSGKPREVLDLVAERNGLTDKKLEETLKSGQTRFYNQVHWARQYLVWEGLLDGSKHGVWSLTSTGYETSLDDKAALRLALKWGRIHAAARRKSEEGEDENPSVPEVEAVVEEDYKYLLLELLKKVTPQGFERICARLLRESGLRESRLQVDRRTKESTASESSKSILLLVSRYFSNASDIRAPYREPRSATSATQ